MMTMIQHNDDIDQTHDETSDVLVPRLNYFTIMYQKTLKCIISA